MAKKVLLVQYFRVSSGDEAYRNKRQAEIDACLRLNLDNPHLDEVHVLTETWTDFAFLEPVLVKNSSKSSSDGA
jgi:hypothetical protein